MFLFVSKIDTANASLVTFHFEQNQMTTFKLGVKKPLCARLEVGTATGATWVN
jgi:hypothetical protein